MNMPSPDLSIIETRVYRGANVWSYDKAIHLVVELGSLEEFPTHTINGFTDHVLQMLPGLREHSCSRGRRGGFVERLNEGTWLGHVAEHVALALQQVVGHDIRRGKTRQVKGHPGRYNIIYGYVDENVGLAAARLAVRLVNHLVEADNDFDWEQELDAFILRAQRSAFGPSTQAIVEEAVSRDIPWIRLNQHSLVQLGQGVHQKRIRATMTSATSAIAVDVASDKDLTTRLLGAAGLPVPKQESVRTADQAVTVADRIGYPVVVKPLDGNHGRGVCLDLQDGDDVREAFAIAKDQSRRGTVIVESYITGRDYRCLIIDGRLAAVAERVPAHVIGDGRSSIEDLVELTNADPRRGVGSREGADPDQGRRRGGAAAGRSGLPAHRRAVRGRDGQADPHRQHVDRWHLDRPHLRGAPGERRDRRGGRPDGRPRHRRHRLHLPRHHRARPGDRRRDLRGQRGARLPDAHAPDDRRPAVHLQARGRHALPAGCAEPDPDRGGHRHQRQDHDVADDLPRLQGHGPQGRHDLDRRRRDRRAPGDPRRRLRPEVGPDGPPEPPRRLRGLRGRPGRHPARGSRLRAQRRRRRRSTCSPTTWACAGSTPSSSSPT